MSITWKIIPFANLTVEELYETLSLRQEIFVVEQNCPYLDADFQDQNAVFVQAYADKKLIAHARILIDETAHPIPKIGRVLTHIAFRNQGIAFVLMEKCLAYLLEYKGSKRCKISAQSHLQNFYEKLGFVVYTDEYLEDNIPHLGMQIIG